MIFSTPGLYYQVLLCDPPHALGSWCLSPVTGAIGLAPTVAGSAGLPLPMSIDSLGSWLKANSADDKPVVEYGIIQYTHRTVDSTGFQYAVAESSSTPHHPTPSVWPSYTLPPRLPPPESHYLTATPPILGYCHH